MFSAESWKRPDSEPVKPCRPEWPEMITGKSFRAFLGEERVSKWTAACASHGLNFAELIQQAGRQANTRPHLSGYVRHTDARGDLRVLISDGIRDFLTAAGTPAAPRPMLY